MCTFLKGVIVKKISREKYLWKYLYSEIRCLRNNSNPELEQWVKAARYAKDKRHYTDKVRSLHLETLSRIEAVKQLLKGY